MLGSGGPLPRRRLQGCPVQVQLLQCRRVVSKAEKMQSAVRVKLRNGPRNLIVQNADDILLRIAGQDGMQVHQLLKVHLKSHQIGRKILRALGVLSWPAQRMENRFEAFHLRRGAASPDKLNNVMVLQCMKGLV